MKFKVGDTVVVIAGKYRRTGDKNEPATGKIIKLDKKNNRVVVEGLNMVTKHVKKRGKTPGQLVNFEAAIEASNIMLLDPKTKKATRIGHTIDKDGKKQRIAKKSKTVI
jgi:large subunit ribosomal protein L24